MLSRTLTAAVVALLPVVVRAQSGPQELTIVAPAAPGGGWDQTARVMQQVLRSAGLASAVQVTNVPGAAGTIGLARFVSADRGNGHALLVTGLVMVSGVATNHSPVSLADVTPIARLSGEYEVIVVPASSPYHTLDALVTAFKANPRGVSWGGGSAGGTDEILVRLLADAVGVSRGGVNYIAYSGGGQALAAVLGAHVSAAVSGLGEFAAQIESGALRALAISAPQRVAGSSIPTFVEQGVSVELMNWRGVVAPPGVSRSDRRALEALVAAMTATADWKAALQRNGWTDLTLMGDAFGRFLAEETRRVVPLVVGGNAGGRPDWFMWTVLGALGCSLAAAGIQTFRRKSARNVAAASDRIGADPALNVAAGTDRIGNRPPLNRSALGLVALAVGLQIVLMRPAGFVAASALMFTLAARAFGSRRTVRDACIAVAVAGLVFLAFARGLGVALPSGPFG